MTVEEMRQLLRKLDPDTTIDITSIELKAIKADRKVIARGRPSKEGAKRQYFEGLDLEEVPCPVCKRPVKPSLGEYLSFPTDGQPVMPWAYCNACHHEWNEEPLVLRVEFRLEAPEAP